MNDKQNKKYIIIICITVFTLIIVGLSFAFINKANTANNVNIAGNVITDIPHTWTFNNENTEITLNITAEDMLYGDTSSYVSFDFENDLKLNSTKDSSLQCKYDIVYKAENQYIKSNTTMNEFTISGTSSKSDTLSELEIPQIYTGATSIIGTYDITPADGKVTWNFQVRFYNVDADQQTVLDSKPSGYVYFTERHCGD